MSDKSVAAKLHIKTGDKVLLLNAPPDYAQLLGPLPSNVLILAGPTEPANVIQLFVRDRRELEELLPPLKGALAPDGKLWVTYLKSTARLPIDIHRDSINAYAQSLGLVGVAIIAVDANWAALRLKASA